MERSQDKKDDRRGREESFEMCSSTGECWRLNNWVELQIVFGTIRENRTLWKNLRRRRAYLIGTHRDTEDF